MPLPLLALHTSLCHKLGLESRVDVFHWKLSILLEVSLRDLTNIELLGTTSNFPIRGQTSKISVTHSRKTKSETLVKTLDL